MLDEKFYIQLKIFLRGKELRKRKLPNVVVQLMRCFTLAVNDNIIFTVLRLKTSVSVQFEVDLPEANKWNQSQQ